MKTFQVPPEYAVKTQIWIAIIVSVLVVAIKKHMKIELSLYTILEILSISIFEKMSILQALTEIDDKNIITNGPIQLNLYCFLLGAAAI